MLKKYQQLGEAWNDKKYRELGVIVQECNKAFNEILKTLYVSDKFLQNLVKSINEYEKINFYNESSVTALYNFYAASVVTEASLHKA